MFNFGGSIRGFGDHPKIGAQMGLDFEFRRYLKHFKGPKLHIFTAITLHANREGWAWPSIGQLEEETGYEPSTISDAIEQLRKTIINGQRVLLIVKERVKGRFSRNKYLIFPSAAEVKQYEKPAETTVPETPVRSDQNGLTSSAPPVVTEDSQIKSLPEKDQNLKESESLISEGGENARVRAAPPPPEKPTDYKNKVVEQAKPEEPVRRAAPPKPHAVQVASNPTPPPVPRPPSAPVPSEPLFEALGAVCLDNRLAYKIQATRTNLEQVLVEIMAVEPDLTPERLKAFGNWWPRTHRYLKDRPRPYLNQVVGSWAEFQGAEPVLTVPDDAVEEYYEDDESEVPHLPAVVERAPIPSKAADVWNAVIGQLQVQLNKATFNSWVQSLQLVEFSEDADTWYFVIGAQHIYGKDWVEKHLIKALVQSLEGFGKTLMKTSKHADVEVIISDPLPVARRGYPDRVAQQ